MSELLKTLKGIRIKTKQIADSDVDNSAHLSLGLPKRRYKVNVNSTIQNSSNERYTPEARPARIDREIYKET